MMTRLQRKTLEFGVLAALCIALIVLLQNYRGMRWLILAVVATYYRLNRTDWNKIYRTSKGTSDVITVIKRNRFCRLWFFASVLLTFPILYGLFTVGGLDPSHVRPEAILAAFFMPIVPAIIVSYRTLFHQLSHEAQQQAPRGLGVGPH